MATEQNNLHMNSFLKGMNADAAYDKTPNELYVFGKNIRITNNTLIAADIDANTTEGIVTPIPSGKRLESDSIADVERILAINTIGNKGAIIVKHRGVASDTNLDLSDTNWSVYKMIFEPESNKLSFKHLFTSTRPTKKKQFSTVINNEIEGVTNLYIADGYHPIMQINIDDEDYLQKISLNNDGYEFEDRLSSNRIFPTDKVKIVQKISGLLYTQLLQYTYRFYHKHGVSSQLAPLTSKIQVIDDSRSKEVGNAENTKTSIGFQLSINTNADFRRTFDHILVYRLSYLKTGQNAQINLIYDALLSTADTTIINDTGFAALETLTIEEFAALLGLALIPEVIESNLGYLFAASIQDKSTITVEHSIAESFDAKAYQCNKSGQYILWNESDTESKTYNHAQVIAGMPSSDKFTINKYTDINDGDKAENDCRYCNVRGLKYYGGNGANVSWRFIVSEVSLHDNYNDTLYPDAESDVRLAGIHYLKYNSAKLEVELSNDILLSEYFKQQNLPNPTNNTYNDLFVSSKLRSLRRGEVYRYGIVLYTKYGTRSDVMWIADIRTPSILELPIVKTESKKITALPLGIQFTVNTSKLPDVIGYEIVRCETSPEYSSILTQCVVSRPVRQKINEKWSPYYPTGILSSLFIAIASGFGIYKPYDYRNDNKINGLLETNIGIFDGLHQSVRLNGKWYGTHATGESTYDYRTTNNKAANFELENAEKRMSPCFPFPKHGTNAIPHSWDVLQIFNSEIQIYRNDLESLLLQDSLKIVPLCFVTDCDLKTYESRLANKDLQCIFTSKLKASDTDTYVGTYILHRNGLSRDDKTTNSSIYHYYNFSTDVVFEEIGIKAVSDVKNPTWENMFTKVQPLPTEAHANWVSSAIALYKSYISAVGSIMYNNWVSSGVYGMKVSASDVVDQTGDDRYDIETLYYSVGPGPQCFIVNTDTPFDPAIKSITDEPGKRQVLDLPALRCQLDSHNTTIGTHLCNIKHTAIQFAGILESQKQYDIYYGFGNYVNVENSSAENYVFDGTIYITPCEIQTMFKAYDFNYPGNLYSNQIINYVPMESTINNYFDYGMNYKNTASINLLLKPGDIEGVNTQERPLHQYNDIYSDNSMSNNVFTAESIEQSVDTFKQRIVYSQHKTIGENVDSWGVFKVADFIDADGRYGEITELYTMHDTLFMWQEQAFGKLSVNERSLVKDENSNTIQLGTGDVLQRVDYLSTRYGMRKEDFSVNDVSNVLFWVDVNNKALAAYNEGVLNLSEQSNVQNILNKYIDDTYWYIPTVHVDLQNDEVLFKCLKDDEQLVFNYKYRFFTSVYSRAYKNIADFKNVLCGINISNYNISTTERYNYLTDYTALLSPQQISFVVNPSAVIAKVFDNQKLVTMLRGYDETFVNDYFNRINYTFTTDLNTTNTTNVDGITDREGNILYVIPRQDHSVYGDRIRGKWMKVDIDIEEPKRDFAISSVLTKFRQSFS